MVRRHGDHQVIWNLEATFENSLVLFHSRQLCLWVILYSSACQESLYLFSYDRACGGNRQCFRSKELKISSLLGPSQVVFKQQGQFVWCRGTLDGQLGYSNCYSPTLEGLNDLLET